MTNKQVGGGKGFVQLTLLHHQRNLGQELKQVRNLEEGADTEAMVECCLLACSSYCLMEPRITSLGLAPPRMHWSLSHQLLIKKMPYNHNGLPTTQSYGGIVSIETPSSIKTIACVKLA